MDDAARAFREQTYIRYMPPEQAAALKAAFDAGWRLETDWQKIKARYEDIDLANDVPRAILYVDLGVLMGHIATLEAFLVKEGYKLPETT